MELSNIQRQNGKIKSAKRVGRGCGSGKGMHTTGRGNKGQLARTGSKPPLGYEGGQEPLYKRLPHIGGFKRPFSKKIANVSLSAFNSFRKGSKITPKELLEAGILKNIPSGGVKILNNGRLEKELTFLGFQMSSSARKQIEESGSKIING
ncbi:50S ribosomal protein L15 [Patescibacteria group bacterium]|nr:50S ribosomal protein L15 [Patescibacteria group bacterium]HOM78138.1 50S ribosomal protein L15 [bacterium]